MNSVSLNIPENMSDYLPVLIPLIVLQLVLIILAVRDILKQEQFKFGSVFFGYSSPVLLA